MIINNKKRVVGIDDISIAIPKRYIDTRELADLRGIPPEKYTEGIGVKRIAILTDETVDSLAADAIIDLIRKNDLNPKDIGRIYTATESSMDESKPLVCFVLGRMEEKLGQEFKLNHIQGLENKFACIGGSYSLYDTCNWILSDMNDGKVGIVVCADEARYDVNSSGEPTQGAGAVAMLVKDNPRLIGLDFSCLGVFTQDNNDFYRPFGKRTPIVNGELSNFSYLFAMRSAFDRFKKKYEEKDRSSVLIDFFDYLVFHTPYPKITKHGLAFLFRHELRGTERWERICKELGIRSNGLVENVQDKIEDVFSNKELMDEDYAIRKKLFNLPEFADLYKNKVESSLFAPTNIGNTYTASIFLSLSSLLELQYRKKRLEIGKKIGFGAYGSGSGSLVFYGTLAEEYASIVSKIGLIKKIEDQEKLPISEYEELKIKDL
ncbi:MAG: hydroxymethylglutaryl-CoA synthase family protein [Candidatus Methanoliparum thermophilum]|uniref:Hydroxymethylglutaryl-CoA synthase family protein n=1 Tax=Methanoliparum thermophilum TaxID=2491083 RepID=A0A520KSJ1_METT2|nr:hydroxymethylglutaryl-CoA synthase [Candidatus Methanoliparum sp. LAM-1]RZN64573.1 MAG: hydroxymethylglutaryl-CoA synthase family protein [Candidatus Methanoliparum thermophilum]BDC35826.1 hydroxymethylglutaryl-CoA synthase [Candidatus Methanoliparum sp. LAM-1]